LTAAIGGKHSGRNSDRSANNQCEECKSKRRRVPVKYYLTNKRLKFEGLAKIPVAELQQVMSILRAQRQIQSKRMTQLSQLPGRRALAQHLFDGIAWHDMDHQKNERQNDPEGWEGKEKSFEEVAAAFALKDL